jgi:hypothetical protein
MTPGTAARGPGPAGADQPGPEPQQVPQAVRPVSDDDRVWATLAGELTPAKSLERVDTATDRVVRTVTIIGTLLGGLGVFGATKPSVSGPARWITIAAVACAALAVACALAAQILTITRHLNPENLAAVRAWYKRRIDTRGYPTRAATVLLLAGAVLAGAAAIVALATATPSQPAIAVTRSLDHAPVTAGSSTPGTGAPPSTTITAQVTFRGLTSGQSATVVVSVAGSGQVLASAAITPDTDGTATRTITVSGLPAAEPVTVQARGGSQQCRAALGAGSARPLVTCGPAS